MSKIALGTAAIGRPVYMNIRGSKPAQQDFNLAAFKSINKAFLSHAYDLGIRDFDTAPNYGIAEQALLEWLNENNLGDVSLSSKWGYTYTANFDPHATSHEQKEHSLEKLNEQWAFTKQLLPYLKIYQIHSATFQTGVLDNVEILERLNEIKENNNILIGLTVTGDNQVGVIDKALSVVVNGSPLFDSFQATFNVFDQSLIERREMLAGKNIIIKEALANGRVFPNENYPNYKANYSLLKAMAEKHNVGVDAVALRFCMQSIKDCTVLSGASTNQQLEENLKANSFILDETEMDQIKSLKVRPEDYWQERKQLAWN